MKTVKKQVRGLSRKQRLEELRAFVALCLASLEDYDLKEVSNMTHLSLATIYRLHSGQVSLCTHYGTLQALGYAAKLRLTWDDMEIRIALIN